MSVFQPDYPDREKCEQHWAKVRAGLITSSPAPTKSLADRADAQISRLRREIAEWEQIKHAAPAAYCKRSEN